MGLRRDDGLAEISFANIKHWRGVPAIYLSNAARNKDFSIREHLSNLDFAIPDYPTNPRTCFDASVLPVTNRS